VSDVLDAILARLDGLPEQERKETLKLAVDGVKELFVPNPGPQVAAYFSEADELFYGGAAGCGKSALLAGIAINSHRRSILFRREYPQIKGLVDECARILGSRDGYNAQEKVWKLGDGRELEFGSVPHEDDKERFQGRPHDLVAFDEICHFTKSQYRFLIGWNRSAIEGQRCRIVAAGNPPLTAEGAWVVSYWRPWLDATHPNPAAPGELRWFTTIDGEDVEVDGRGPHLINGREVFARSRTFIGGRLEDNPDLIRSGYASTLEAMPEPMRTMLREGRFDVGMRDNEFQVIPTSWVLAAQSRWTPDGGKDFAMTAMGFDPAGGGDDAAALAFRHGGWVAPLVTDKGDVTADGDFSARVIFKYRKDNCPVVVDMGGGYGGSVSLRLKDNGVVCAPFNGAGASNARTKDGANLSFRNKRAESWWRLREALNPESEHGDAIALPPDPELRADLCAPTWELSASGILIESKDDIRKRLGRSTNKGDAVVMCCSEGTAVAKKLLYAGQQRPQSASIGYSKIKERYRGKR
jgi:hypothetical protein